MVAVIGPPDIFAAVKLGILPDPPAPRPIAVLELVQEILASFRLLIKLVELIMVPAHRVELAGTITVGKGYTVMV